MHAHGLPDQVSGMVGQGRGIHEPPRAHWDFSQFRVQEESDQGRSTRDVMFEEPTDVLLWILVYPEMAIEGNVSAWRESVNRRTTWGCDAEAGGARQSDEMLGGLERISPRPLQPKLTESQ